MGRWDTAKPNNKTSRLFWVQCKHKGSKESSRLITQKIHKELSDVFTGIGCLEGIFKLRVKEGSHPCQALPRRLGYALQQPRKEDLDRLQKQQIFVP